MTEKMWLDLMEMELTTDIQQLRMHRREASHYTSSVAQFGSYADYDKEPNGYTVPPITAPSYGYGWSRLKCKIISQISKNKKNLGVVFSYNNF
jgi:hypothetical protein